MKYLFWRWLILILQFRKPPSQSHHLGTNRGPCPLTKNAAPCSRLSGEIQASVSGLLVVPAGMQHG